MSRFALCLFLFAFFHYGIQKSSQADNSTKQADNSTEETKQDVTTKEPVTEDESKKDKDTTKSNADDKKTKSPLDKLNPAGIQFTGKIIEPIKNARGKISEVVARTMDTAKDTADGAYNFFKDAVTTFF